MDFSFEHFRILHIILAIVFIYILTPALPLTTRHKSLHRLFGWSYVVILFLLVLGGYHMDLNLFILKWDNIHALVNIFLRNLIILLFCLLGIFLILPPAPKAEGPKKFAFRLTSALTLAGSLVILIYGLLTEQISTPTNRSAILIPVAHIHPSYLLFGLFVGGLALSYLWQPSLLDQNKAERLKIHRRHMAAALFISLLNPLTVEVNRFEVFHADNLYTLLMLMAIGAYFFERSQQKKQTIVAPARWLSYGLILVLIISSAAVFYYKKKPLSYFYYGIKILSFKGEPGGPSKFYIPDINVAGCKYFPKFQRQDNGNRKIIRIIQCHDPLAMRSVMSEIVSKQSDGHETGEFSLNSAIGIGPEARELIEREDPIPVVLLNFGGNNTSVIKDYSTQLEELNCRSWIDFNVINYVQMLPKSSMIKIYQCPAVRPRTRQFGQLLSMVNASNADVSAVIIFRTKL